MTVRRRKGSRLNILLCEVSCSVFLQLKFGWYCNPIFGPTGDYHQMFKDAVADITKQVGASQSVLPEFTEEEKRLNKGWKLLRRRCSEIPVLPFVTCEQHQKSFLLLQVPRISLAWTITALVWSQSYQRMKQPLQLDMESSAQWRKSYILIGKGNKRFSPKHAQNFGGKDLPYNKENIFSTRADLGPLGFTRCHGDWGGCSTGSERATTTLRWVPGSTTQNVYLNIHKVKSYQQHWLVLDGDPPICFAPMVVGRHNLPPSWMREHIHGTYIVSRRNISAFFSCT